MIAFPVLLPYFVERRFFSESGLHFMACSSVLTQEERVLQQLRTALLPRDDRLPELFLSEREQRQFFLQLLQQQLLRQLTPSVSQRNPRLHERGFLLLLNFYDFIARVFDRLDENLIRDVRFDDCALLFQLDRRLDALDGVERALHARAAMPAAHSVDH